MTISAHTTSNLDKALALADNLGFYVFPCRPNAEEWANGRKLEAKSPRTNDGFYSATTDPEQIRKFWNTWPDSLVGVYTGASGLNVLDGDTKGGIDYDLTLFEHGLDTPDTHTYETISGGRHYIYTAPAGIPMSGAAKYRGLPGVDRRAGASYIIWWGEDVPESRDAFTVAPEWLCDPVVDSEGSSGYSGDAESWLDEHSGEPSALFKHIIAEDFSDAGEGEYEHDATLRLIVRIVTLGASGERGAATALKALADKYLDGYEEYESEFDAMVTWAIKNCGGTVVAELPSFMDVLGKLGEDFPPELLTTGSVEAVVSECLSRGFTDAEAFVIANNNRDIDADTLWTVIALERENLADAAVTPEPVPEAPKPEPVRKSVELITAKERQRAKEHYAKMWPGEWEEWAKSQLRVYNEDYLRAGAWMALANLCGDMGSLSIDGTASYPNLFTFLLGPTTSGKTAHDKLMMRTIRECHPEEDAMIVGGNSSGNGLSDILLKRDRKQTLLKVNEAGSFISAISDHSGKGSWQSDVMDKITDYYDGFIEPKVRSGSDEEVKWVHSCFSIYLYGTPEKMEDALTREMFMSGFLMRVQWYVGARRELTLSERGVRLTEYQKNEAAEIKLAEWKKRFTNYKERSFFSKETDKGLIWFESDAVADWFQNKTAVIEAEAFAGRRDEELLGAALTRHNIAAMKMGALLALADGRRSISKDDLLTGLWQCESSLTNMLEIYGRVASSEHSKNLETVFTFIAGFKTGPETWEVLRWGADRHGWTERDTNALLGELVSQKRVKRERLGEKEWRYVVKEK